MAFEKRKRWYPVFGTGGSEETERWLNLMRNIQETWEATLWYGEVPAETGQDGDVSWIIYGGRTDSDGDKVTVQLVDGNNWMILTKGGREEVSFYMEFVKTSYGYAAQYYYSSWDTNNHFLFTAGDKEKTFFMGEKDGVIGVTSSDGIPPRLTGNEAPDFPKSAPEWYSVEGEKLIYMTAEGKEYTYDRQK